MKLNCIIIDDEPIARQIVEGYVKQLPALQLVGIGEDAFEALQLLQSNPVDLMFLDINMPNLSGLSLLKSLNNPPQVIITTAHTEYAIEGFELAGADYLLKPFSLARFIQAVDRVVELHKAAPGLSKEVNDDFIFVKADKKIVRVFIDDISYVEAYGNFIKIHLSSKMVLSAQTLTSFENLLPAASFIRIHKSYIVPIRHIDSLEGNQLMVAQHKLPVGKRYRKILLEKLKIG